ncbi:SSH4 family protein [Aspergillus aculeatinus CBS 121060]|uniref:D-lactate dehydrogenase n=1 Tax=Aspergillus aculeatinus CBS 121060 TaxID=1448322 RepID=A0ACD1HBP1_9EURO|nr:D-lactate dehydrogenase [Aspergillus aculeatinus CBS 121060]RAH71227.1 D-lactate dehydrogenase [Aspergillus aculeatinus CBS 121060]
MDQQPKNICQESPPDYAYVVASSSASTFSQPLPPPYHNWQESSEEDSLPPPPAAGFLYSSTGNASSHDALRAHEFCDAHPLRPPAEPSVAAYRSVEHYDFTPVRPLEFHGNVQVARQGRWTGSTGHGNSDSILTTNLPLYFSLIDSPLRTNMAKLIYFEVKLLGLGERSSSRFAESSGFAIGYVAKPYPSWRSPGWERGSLGVFSDDGCRFVNDSWGGKPFTSKFREGETVGLGMVFRQSCDKTRVDVTVCFTRDGQQVGAWDLAEERDEDSGGIQGLEGDFDLYGAIGLFGVVEFVVEFNPTAWLWTPSCVV